MEPVPERLVALLIDAGPWLVFAVTASETAIFIGLLVPAEATVLLAAFLADRGIFRIEHILLATLAGGFIGDQIGYMLGRFSGRRVSGKGRLAHLWRRYERAAGTLFRRRSILAISFARFVSFVRTLMPWFAGMSRIPYPRFFFYDLLGVLGWGVGSVALGYLAGESWHLVAEWLGTASAALILVALLVTIAVVRRRRVAAAPPSPAGAVDPWVASLLDVAETLDRPSPSPTETEDPSGPGG